MIFCMSSIKEKFSDFWLKVAVISWFELRAFTFIGKSSEVKINPGLIWREGVPVFSILNSLFIVFVFVSPASPYFAFSIFKEKFPCWFGRIA